MGRARLQLRRVKSGGGRNEVERLQSLGLSEVLHSLLSTASCRVRCVTGMRLQRRCSLMYMNAQVHGFCSLIDRLIE